MKKYISILSVITALFMQSCERSDSDLNTTVEKELSIEVQNNKEYSRTESKDPEEIGSSNLETGDDDEPKRDKQHWKMINDTIPKI